MSRNPTRTCTGCRVSRPQHELIRIARGPDGGVRVGRTAPGRGAYVCPAGECVEAALSSGRLRKALRLAGRLPEDLKDRMVRETTDG